MSTLFGMTLQKFSQLASIICKKIVDNLKHKGNEALKPFPFFVNLSNWYLLCLFIFKCFSTVARSVQIQCYSLHHYVGHCCRKKNFVDKGKNEIFILWWKVTPESRFNCLQDTLLAHVYLRLFEIGNILLLLSLAVVSWWTYFE